MAAPQPVRIRHFSIYYGGRKVATANGNEYTITSGDEPQYGDEGYIGHSDGATHTGLQTDTIVPVAGVGVSLLTDMLAKKYATIALGIVDGKVHQITMRIVEAVYTGNATAGTLTGRFRFEGGVPKAA